MSVASSTVKITKEQVESVFNINTKYTKFKSLDSDQFEVIAGVCDEIIKSSEDRGDYWAINFEANDSMGDFDIFTILFKDVLNVTLNKNGAIIEGIIRKKDEVERPRVINHLLKCFDDGKGVPELSFKLVGGSFKAHKFIMIQMPYFERSRSEKELEVDFGKYNYKVVYPYIRYRYGAELNLEVMDIPSCIEMIELINFVGCGTGDKSDKAMILDALSKKVTESNFEPLVQTSSEDSDLKESTFNKLSEFMRDGKIDFSPFPLDTLTKIYLLVKGSKSKESLISEIGRKLKFDPNFITLCDNAEKELKKVLKKGWKLMIKHSLMS